MTKKFISAFGRHTCATCGNAIHKGDAMAIDVDSTQNKCWCSGECFRKAARAKNAEAKP